MPEEEGGEEADRAGGGGDLGGPDRDEGADEVDEAECAECDDVCGRLAVVLGVEAVLKECSYGLTPVQVAVVREVVYSVGQLLGQF